MYYKVKENKYASAILTKEEVRLVTAGANDIDEEIKKALAFEKTLRIHCGIINNPVLQDLSVSCFDTGEIMYIWLPEDMLIEYDDNLKQIYLDRMEEVFFETYCAWNQVYLGYCW